MLAERELLTGDTLQPQMLELDALFNVEMYWDIDTEAPTLPLWR